MVDAVASVHSCRLSESSRLLNAADFQSVFDQATFKVSTPELLILARANTLQQPRLGLVIGKKNIRRAVQRNRIKRIIRETFRLRQQQLGAVDAIVLARSGLDAMDNMAIRAALNHCWAQLQKRIAKVAGEPMS